VTRATSLSRRALLGAGLALVGCRPAARAQLASQAPPLRRLARFPLGAEIVARDLSDPDAMSLLLANFSQVTPGMEMKMERILRDDGSFDFSGADAMADFTRRNGLRLHAVPLVWYIYRPPSFTRLQADPAAFASAYRAYINTVAGRYAGRVAGWDVVNEPVAEDGDGYRDCLWREAFGLDYIDRAFHHAREADPDAVLLLNEYNLESNPAKLASYLRLVENLLKRGVPLTGLGTQMHMQWNQDPETIAPMMRELGAFGLPIHVSEVDVTTRGPPLDPTSQADRLSRQADLVAAAAEAFQSLPARQRYAFTVWGLRDRDSWLRYPELGGDASDQPLLFDDTGRAKPAAEALARVLGGRNG
jgi:endo-1,4-beta-xylanase